MSILNLLCFLDTFYLFSELYLQVTKEQYMVRSTFSVKEEFGMTYKYKFVLKTLTCPKNIEQSLTITSFQNILSKLHQIQSSFQQKCNRRMRSEICRFTEKVDLTIHCIRNYFVNAFFNRLQEKCFVIDKNDFRLYEKMQKTFFFLLR